MARRHSIMHVVLGSKFGFYWCTELDDSVVFLIANSASNFSQSPRFSTFEVVRWRELTPAFLSAVPPCFSNGSIALQKQHVL